MYKRIGNYKIGFRYHDMKTNKEISNVNIISYIKNLKIPPAYNNVVISSNPNSKIIAYGYDSKGRKQVIYNKEYVQKRSIFKFKKIMNLHQKIKKLKNHTIKQLSKSDTKTKQLFIIIFLIFECGFRIGNKKYEKLNNSYGISTIKCKHLSFYDNTVCIDFIGKKGVRNIGISKNIHVYEYLKNQKDKKSNEDYVFSLSSQEINNFLKKWDKNITSKDLRTWNANCIYINAISENIKKGEKKPTLLALKEVAKRIHNTPAVCKKNYINPEIIDFFEKKLKNDITK